MSQGINVDVIELHKEVFDLAREYSFCNTSGVRYHQLDDAENIILGPENKINREKYDVIVHDVFGGGSVTQTLFTSTFLGRMKFMLSSHQSIAVIGYFGIADEGFLSIYSSVSSFWRYTRVFQDVLIVQEDSGEKTDIEAT